MAMFITEIYVTYVVQGLFGLQIYPIYVQNIPGKHVYTWNMFRRGQHPKGQRQAGVGHGTKDKAQPAASQHMEIDTIF